jgi:hypothetical protein
MFPRAVADKVYYEHRFGIICSVDIVKILMAARGLLMWVLPGQLWPDQWYWNILGRNGDA